jgi:hypothetical protein
MLAPIFRLSGSTSQYHYFSLSVCFVLFTVDYVVLLHNVITYMYTVLCLQLALQLLTQHVNNKEINYYYYYVNHICTLT